MTKANSPLRVLFVDQSGELGGAELCLLDLVVGRGKKDGVVLLSEGPFADRLRSEGIWVEVLPLEVHVSKKAGVARQLWAAPRVWRAARRLAKTAQGYDVVVANTQKAAVLAALASRRSRRPFVWFLHDLLDADHFSAANRRTVLALTNRKAVHVIANSQATANVYRQAGGRQPATVIYNGMRAEPYDACRAEALRREIGVPDGGRLVGVFGRLTPWKGQHVLLEALLDEKLQECHVIVVGGALFTEEDKAYEKKLRIQARAEKLKGRVHFLGHCKEITGLMKACDVVAHTSTSPEPFGRVIVEAMLAGTPVIATDAGGAKEIVDDQRTGLLVPPGDASALAVAIRRYFENPVWSEDLARRGTQTALERFDLHSVLCRWERILEEVVSGQIRLSREGLASAGIG